MYCYSINLIKCERKIILDKNLIKYIYVFSNTNKCQEFETVFKQLHRNETKKKLNNSSNR